MRRSATNLNVWSEIAHLLREAADDGDHPFALPTLCSSGSGGLARGRMVVLRAADPDAATLRTYTDTRSVKVDHLQAHPEFSYVFWDRETRYQLMCGGPTHWADAAETDAVFADLPKHSRKAYATRSAPGTPLPGGGSDLPEDWDSLDLDGTDYARENFGILVTTLAWADVLQLDRDGNRRALGHRRAGEWTWEWITP
ncbi:pyridoxamine 5'-phosphate oxidase family protein [Lewinella sp. IMCC34183]|uniref:pyridoxamine 5'-phosphate oxidase family protein n=1 Tax=Lewinella sp. IMCC34183 TaxID=2248762 RepID=UPI000E281E6E|nr:pyridoxamine 5'-phosphate oxidase family protein [Lewinella sp. IMCC34183]